jgi:PelA/Pel-15E family pectate lyase
MYEAHERDDYKVAALRGIRWILDAQFPNGGWPQVFPLEPGYHEHITLNDGAMQHALEIVNRVAAGDPPFAWVEEPFRAECRDAFQAGLRCLADAQVRVGGVPTVWCAQHDPLTLQPAAARLKEPVSLSGGESVDILKFLMREGPGTPAVLRMVRAATGWLNAHRITDLRKGLTANGKTTYLPDPSSTEVYWARFYDPTTFAPMYTGSDDGIVYDSFVEMARYNKVAYSYLTARPLSILSEKELARWKKRIATTGSETE